MDKIACYSAFASAAETQSFVAAGRQLGVTPSAVGKNVARLEAFLGVRLLQRSTRHIQLTDEGALFYPSCREILARMAEAENLLSEKREAPGGRLRVSAIVMGYRFLAPVLAEFQQNYPQIELDIDFDDRIVDLIEDRFDVAIRSGVLPDSRLKARKIGAFKAKLYASRSYLKARGIPTRFEDLRLHACIRFRNHTSGMLDVWRDPFVQTGEPAADIPATLIVNNIEAALAGAVHGLGICRLPTFVAREAV
jgi:DNA-binding transcriptional LysR family regulator